MTQQASIGCYGKVPCVGDFVSRRMTRSFIEPWDRWLQTAIGSSRDLLGPEWLDIYLTSPIWRFALAAGICGEAAATGILVPSVDKVGRYFPLTLVLALPVSTNPFLLLGATSSDWFKILETSARSLLEDSEASLEGFDRRMGEIDTAAIFKTLETGTLPTELYRGAFHLQIEAVDEAPKAIPLVLWQFASIACTACSVWWTEGSERVGPCILVCDGLPKPQGYNAMLNGDWGLNLRYGVSGHSSNGFLAD
ncbi:MAG: type VI secretion system-associated protein TagF [Gammaproteobacteria bacterium]